MRFLESTQEKERSFPCLLFMLNYYRANGTNKKKRGGGSSARLETAAPSGPGYQCSIWLLREAKSTGHVEEAWDPEARARPTPLPRTA